MTIKHLVLVGGGPNVFIHYGILKTLSQKNYIDVNSIESIHATSCGSIAGLILLLSNNWEDIDDYLINRPWEKIFTIKPTQLFNAIKSLGIYDSSLFMEMFKPFMEINDMDINITLKEFYEKKKVDFYFYVTKYDDIEPCTISHKTHPDLKLFTAVHMTCGIPVIFKPVLYENKLYFDGALFKNYPLKDCIENTKDINCDEIFGIKQSNITYDEEQEQEKEQEKEEEEKSILENLDLFKFLYNSISRLMQHINIVNYKDYDLKNEIQIKIHNADLAFWKKVMSSKEQRTYLIKEGEEYADKFLNN
jgi:predicted acylesterase/phospholipase RssA